ncbi:hypothetical protein JF780_07720 [Mycobacterium intracellulare]|uniref:hypothetical protein n=1 Tax=Mycobacterium intracellulare TaxID=1767 RepID=UPI001CDA5070|nr:hypothetical protein [Mycobacterium intracellulare]MCA2272423.1 hypothetical protein [Mycobacterium intracellulare]MCA2324839.1 hypothetical protein [Mycobacterium intracellulare]
MGVLIALVFWAVVAYLVYRRFKRQWNRTSSSRQKSQLMPANVAGIVGVLLFLPGFWILRVEGWKETLSTNLATGETSTTSTFWSQFGRAAVYFAIGGALVFASKVLAAKQTPWPPAVQQQIERLGLMPPDAALSSSAPNGDVGRGAQGGSQFHSPPGWPVPPEGWSPSKEWSPDPAWPPAPPGWQFWSYGPGKAD